MDQDDPEQRIADLERQLAEQKRGTHLPPPSPDHAARRFVAATSGLKASMYIYSYVSLAAFLAPMLAMMFKVPGMPRGKAGWVIVFVVWVVLGILGVLVFLKASPYRKIPISITSDGLTVDQKPGDVYSFADAKLGLWTPGGYTGTMSGTALHLRCGRRSFILGGRDHRVGTATRLEAPPIGHVDGWLRAADFDEVLAMVSRCSGLKVRGPAPGEPLRCLLFPRPSMGAFSSTVRSMQKLNPQPSMAIDVGDDAIWVVDPNTNALIASASLAQVTATPAGHVYYGEMNMTTPVLVVCVPGVQPLTIGCPQHRASWQSRFSWQGIKVPSAKEPAFIVGDGDWRALVEKLGLAPYLGEIAEDPRSGPDRG